MDNKSLYFQISLNRNSKSPLWGVMIKSQLLLFLWFNQDASALRLSGVIILLVTVITFGVVGVFLIKIIEYNTGRF